MPKKKKDRKKSGLVYDPDAKKRLKQQLRAFNWKRFGLLILSTLAAFAVLEAGITLEAKAKMSFSVVTIIYYVIVTALAAAVVILNHWFSKKPFTRDMIREDVPEDEAERILDKLNRRKDIAKRLMPVLIPFIFAILLDFMYLFYGDILKKVFGFLVS